MAAERKKLKAQMKKDYDYKVQELKRDFLRRGEYLVRRVDELNAEEERLAQDGEKLRIKEQALALEAQLKADQYHKKQRAELETLETKVKKRERRMIKQEEELGKEREMILGALKSIKKEVRENRFPLQELKELNWEQDRLVRRKKRRAKAYDSELKKMREELQEKFKEADTEKAAAFAKLQEERQPIVNQKKKLREIEKKLLKREGAELTRLNEEYDDLMNSFEVTRIEKEVELEEIQDRLDDEEDKVAEKQDKLFIDEREAAKRIAENEALILEHIQEIQEARESSAQLQEASQQFLANFEETYKKILSTQSEEYKLFRGKIADLENEVSSVHQSLKQKEQTVKEKSSAKERALNERLKQREHIVDMMEKELRQRVSDYKKYVKELAEVKENMIEEDEGRKTELMESLVKYEDKLSHLGQAFEELSETFNKELEKGNIEIIPEMDERKALEYDDALAKAEWPLVIRHQLGLTDASERPAHVKEYIYRLADKWEERVRIPSGKFQMGKMNSRDAAAFREVTIEKPFLLSKYPVTNVEFYRFITETGYRTEAEMFVDGIVYHHGHTSIGGSSGDSARSSYFNPTLAPDNSAFWLCPDGRPDSLNAKFSHPVTQVTWNDAQEYCRWKSEALEKTVRLPTETEWEYVAGDFGKLSSDEFFWPENEIQENCNIEETGIHSTSRVEHFPERTFNGGVCDLFGNVFEWVQDTQVRDDMFSATNDLIYKIVRGGSFITNYHHIAHWRRLSFLTNYCTSFLGFRTVCEE